VCSVDVQALADLAGHRPVGSALGFEQKVGRPVNVHGGYPALGCLWSADAVFRHMEKAGHDCHQGDPTCLADSQATTSG
jgi:hypothetical protein